MKLSSFVGGSFSVCVLLESVCGGAVCRGVLAAYPPHCARGHDDMRVGSAAHAHIQGYRTLGVAGGVTFWLSGAGKSVF